jgi:predicted acetyltransferase
LSKLTAEESGEFTIRVRDDIVPENEGPWRIVFSPEGIEVTACDAADLEIDVRQFAQAYLGEPSLADLARIGLVDVKSRDALRAATRLLPASPTLCNDFF